MYVEYSLPNFYSELTLTTNDTHYGEQWSLNNTGQDDGVPGVDIKAEKAWEFLQYYNNNVGDSIRVAVIDVGVEQHEDLQNATGTSRVLAGFPIWNHGAPYNSSQWHGQACAGIIASSHNNIGIAGIAPNVLIIPIRISRDISTIDFSHRRISRAIKYAWDVGKADILSNSWQINDFSPLKIAFKEALQYGRNSKGCVIVFSSGNGNTSSVECPDVDGIIPVGAVDRCGKRAGKHFLAPENCEPWPDNQPVFASSYGFKLSLVAPGTHVYTIDRMGVNGLVSGNYNPNFNGTSAACPHVAGVAALILSIRN